MAQPIAALIVRVAADVAELKTGVSEVNATLGGMQGFAQKAGAVLGAAFSVRQIAGAAKDVLSFTSQISDLAAKSGLSAEAVQELDFAAKQSGSTFDTISSALAKMSNALVEGDKSAVASLGAMGLSVSQLKAMTPDAAFQTIAAAIAQIPDPMQRSKVAMDIFGKSGADILPVLMSDIGRLRDVARETGGVMSNELVKAGDDVGDSWERMQTKLNGLKAQALMPVLELFLKMPEPLQTIAGAGLALAPVLSGIGTAIMLAGGPVVALAAMKTALLAIVPYLGPAGIIAAGVGAWVYVFKNLDVIVWAVKAVYEGVKTYLQDKLTAVFDWVTSKIEALKNSFKNLYTAVVGNSYVPDMVTGIASEMAKLDGVMVKPVMQATSEASAGFASMAGSAPSLGGGVRASGSGQSITIQPGAIQVNYPMMRDRRSMDELTAMLTERIMADLRMGTRVPAGV